MSNYGFVYCLQNLSFPGLYKIGCTERSPTRRAQEISRGTGVPSEYFVVAYAECGNHEQVERDVHRRLGEYRTNASREFFAAPLGLIGALLRFNPETIAFVDIDIAPTTMVSVDDMSNPYESRLRLVA